MTAPRALRLTPPLLATAAIVLLAGCAPSTPADSATPVSTAAPSSPVATPEATASAPALPDATCENIIGEASFTELESSGWEYQQEPFFIAGTEIADGVYCSWTNPAEQGGNIPVFGWAPLTAAEASEAQDALEADGWISEDGEDGVFFTENPDFALTVDENGYGMTYFFGEGYAQVADVKAGLVVIERR